MTDSNRPDVKRRHNVSGISSLPIGALLRLLSFMGSIISAAKSDPAQLDVKHSTQPAIAAETASAKI